jgi:hypothetical protein
MVSVSTRFYSFANGPENLIRPDQETPTTWADFQASRDPALAWALAYGPTD